MKILTNLMTCAILLAFTSVACGDIFIDFGRNDFQTTMTGYNNVTGIGTTLDTPSVALVDDTGASTGLTFNTSFANGGSFAGSGADTMEIPGAPFGGAAGSAVQDSIFIRNNDPTASATAGTRITFTLSGLSATDLVDIDLFGSRGNNGAAGTFYFVNGVDITGGGFSSLNNASVFSATGVAADGAGNIEIVYTTNNNEQGGLNVARFQVTSTAIPEPAAAGFLALAGIATVVRRRR